MASSRSPPHHRRRRAQHQHAQQLQQPTPTPRTTPQEQEGGTLLFLTNLLVGALISWGLLRCFEFDFGRAPPQPDAGGHAVLDPSGYADVDERRAAAARFLLDRWAAHDQRGEGGGQHQQLQQRGAEGYDRGDGKGLGLYHPTPQQSSLSVRSGQLIQERYVLQDFIQDLGYTALEEGKACHVQDYAFSIPEFKQIAGGSASSTPSSSAPRMIAGSVAPTAEAEQEHQLLLRSLALTAGGVRPGGGKPPMMLEEWGKRLWQGGGAGDEGDEGAGEGVEEGKEGEEEPGQGAYRLGRKFEGGGQGEIWRAYKVMPDGVSLSPERFVMKRMAVGGHLDIWRCGLREIFYGKRLAGAPHVARYVEHFYRNGSSSAKATGGFAGLELWIVFHDEGASLRRFLYSPHERPPAAGGPGYKGKKTKKSSGGAGAAVDGPAVLFEPSEFWRQLRTAEGGPEVIRGLMRQIVEGAAEVHATGAAHRDLKPSNIILSLEGGQAVVKIADFSSAVDGEALGRGLYGGGGPSQAEETKEYMPPEVLFDAALPYEPGDAQSYDSWSIGVVFLELILGTPHVFTISSRDKNILAHQLRREPEGMRQKAYLLAALADFCVVAEEEEEGAETEEEEGDEGLAPQDLFVHAPTRAGSGAGEGGWMAALKGKWRQHHHHGHGHGHYHSSQRGGDKPEDSSSSSSPTTAGGHFDLGGGGHARTAACTLEDLRKAIQQRDPLDIGFNDPWALHLLSRLLRWHPHERIRPKEALEHAYFKGPYISKLDGSEHALPRDLAAHDRKIKHIRTTPTASAGSHDHHEPEEPPPRSSPHRHHHHSVPAGGGGSKALTPPAKGKGLIAAFSSSILASLAPSAVARSLQRLGPDALDDDAAGSLTPPSRPPQQSPLSSRRDEAPGTYICPKCQREFEAWASCHAHLTARRHGRFCRYETAGLPSCAGSHSMLPLDPHSGWCDVQGRRTTIEDFHNVEFSDAAGGYQCYGIYDGHWGTKAAKFTSRTLHAHIQSLWLDLADESLEEAVREAFIRTNQDLKQLLTLPSPTPPPPPTTAARTAKAKPRYDKSGTTATVAMVFRGRRLLVANVGDSRAVLCCDADGSPLELTVDHVASDPEERRRLEARGARVVRTSNGTAATAAATAGGGESGGDVWRVEGQLALSRSIGDFDYDSVLSRVPHVIVRSLRVEDNPEARHYRYLILASDGLWDVMSNDEAVAFLEERAREMRAARRRGQGKEGGVDGRGMGGVDLDYHVLARALTWEAYVRGSTDNIGVLIVDLQE